MNKKMTKAFTNGKTCIPFITCGDPTLDMTEQLVYAMEEAGADMIELGIPFSDPTVEGSVIQEANIRALENGTTTDKIFQMVERIREHSQIPLIFSTYANVVFSYGVERFVSKAAQAEISAILLTDVPFEEKEEFDSMCKKYGIDFISLISPASNERIAQIAKTAQGFVYCIPTETTDLTALEQVIKKEKQIPCVVGCDDFDMEQIKTMVAQADGIIIQSAIVKLCQTYGKKCVDYVKAYVKQMKQEMVK